MCSQIHLPTPAQPDWYVDDLGSRGMPYQKMDDYLVPPESSHGVLFSPDRLKKGYHVEEIAGGVYWVTTGMYDCMFIRTGAGVIAVDAPPSLGENLLAAIEETTDEPVTHMVYSHWHADHVGAASVFGPNIKRVGHEKTRELLERFPDPDRPVPTETFAKDATLDVNGVKIELSYKGQNHCEGLIFVYVPHAKALAAIDIASPGWVTFRACDMSDNFSGYAQAFDQILEYDFDKVVSGHVSRLGNRADVIEGREYILDLRQIARESLETVEAEYFFKEVVGTPYGAALRYVEEQYFTACTNYGTKKMLTKVTSNGKTWPERLNGADVMTRHNMFSMIEKIRLECNHNGYMKRGNVRPPGFFF